MRFRLLHLGPRLGGVSSEWIAGFLLTGWLLLPFSKSAVEILSGCALALWLLRKWPWDEPLRLDRRLLRPYLLFLAVALVSVAAAGRPAWPLGTRGLFKWLQWLGLFACCAELFADARRARQARDVFLLTACLACLDGLWQMATGLDAVKGYSVDVPGRLVRMQGPFSSPNGLAAMLVPAVPLALGAWIEERRWSLRGIGRALALALTCVSLLLTLSRGALVGLVAAVAAWMILRRLWIGLAAGAGAGAILLATGPLHDNFVASLRPGDVTVSQRFASWADGWRILEANPLLGSGVNTYWLRLSELYPPGHPLLGYAHNSYLQLAAETGVAGLAAFLAAPAYLLWKRRPRWGANVESDALWVGLVGYLVHAAFDNHFFAMQPAFLFWVLWGWFAASPADVSQIPTSGRRA